MWMARPSTRWRKWPINSGSRRSRSCSGDHVFGLEEAAARFRPSRFVVRAERHHAFRRGMRRHGRSCNSMDPATGRRWTQRAQFLNDLYIHKMTVPAEEWRAYAGSDDFLGPLRHRMADIGIVELSEPLLRAATIDAGWRKSGRSTRAFDFFIHRDVGCDRSWRTSGSEVLQSFLENDDTIRGALLSSALVRRVSITVARCGFGGYWEGASQSEHASPLRQS